MTKRACHAELTPAADACLRLCTVHLRGIVGSKRLIDRALLAELVLLEGKPQLFFSARRAQDVIEVRPRWRLVALQDRLRDALRRRERP